MSFPDADSVTAAIVLLSRILLNANGFSKKGVRPFSGVTRCGDTGSDPRSTRYSVSAQPPSGSRWFATAYMSTDEPLTKATCPTAEPSVGIIAVEPSVRCTMTCDEDVQAIEPSVATSENRQSVFKGGDTTPVFGSSRTTSDKA